MFVSVQLRRNAQGLRRDGALPVTEAALGGIARGAQVLTADGPVPVERLRPGDRLVTRERGPVALRRIVAFCGPACTVSPNSFGLSRPGRRLGLGQGQHVVLRGWRARTLFGAALALVPAARLSDGEIVARVGWMVLFRLDLGAPLTVYAEGLEVPTGRAGSGVIAG
jgi:hypothetical protein